MKTAPASKSELEKELTTIEVDAIAEEKHSAYALYSTLDAEVERLKRKMPYPDIDEYTVGADYDEISDIQYKKGRNSPYFKGIHAAEKYAHCGSLYCGHVVFSRDGVQYFITDRSELMSKKIGQSQLINADDRAWSHIIRAWRFPNQGQGASLSRNIQISNRQVRSVDVVLDISNEASANITDAYLKKALLRNKSIAGMQSIIQTIQSKQDEIRSLSLKKSFIVQGCAGSGKTMVLLHRLRYLIFNKDLHDDDYIYLVPGFQFKGFISDICRQFKINDRQVRPFEAYYKGILGVPVDSKQGDSNELVFDLDYLAQVYSVAFMQDCYRSLFNRILSITEKLISCCEKCLNSTVEKRKNELEAQEKVIIDEALAKATEISDPVVTYVGKEIETIEDIGAFLLKLRELYATAKERLAAMNISAEDITISKDDPRILADQELDKLAEEIQNEQQVIIKASIFTVLSHRRKLERLQESYNTRFSAVEKAVIEDERQQRIRKLQETAPVLGNNDLSSVEHIIEGLDNLIKSVPGKLDAVHAELERLTDNIGLQYQSAIDSLIAIIDITSSYTEDTSKIVRELEPCIDYFGEIIRHGKIILASFANDISKKDREELPLFFQKTDVMTDAYIQRLLFEAIKQKIKAEFGIIICNRYKHYWYLRTYCQYLTRKATWTKLPNIFIDESQDLSVSEIELLRKLNTSSDNFDNTKSSNSPILNIFGDVSQKITKHGIGSWKELPFISDLYMLDENFRNTNQVIAYCNQRLGMNMTPIGVDMAAVRTFPTFADIHLQQLLSRTDCTFIVKDEYARIDLEAQLKQIHCSEYSLYTVKEVKGLEFKEVFVITREMSKNEMYVAFTRALVQLNVIEDLPNVTDKTQKLYIQGDEGEQI